MKIRIPFAVVLTALFVWSCDDPISYDNSSFTYNPFSFTEDTLNNVTAIEAGIGELEWGSHFRAWVGETQYYKSGFTVEFVFSDTSLNLSEVDSIQFQVNHVVTYPENGTDTLASNYSMFGFYETMDQAIDIENSAYGNILGSDSMNIGGGNNSWKFTLPSDLIAENDTIVSLGIFPHEADYFSSFYGGGSVSRPELNFFFHEPDTAGNDSATVRHFQSDTLFLHLAEKSGAFDRVQFEYISQLKSDSLLVTLDLQGFAVAGDTLQHIVSASLLPAIDDLASSLYTADSVFRFSMLVEDPGSGLSSPIEYGGDGYNSNQINNIIQSAIDDDKNEIELMIHPTAAGYDPGFIAISKDVSASALYVKSSLAVRP
ncbi:MAG: hypothetical protein H8E26_09305 [FCB group bacterium]|nr:hypothetical protein [FCB group bacterium]MBC8376232.1 hypothetical protein [FCB group bacterium]MBL7029105.1 hypothetical protein [Candidatus Neomarinimicrobiota bacterium]MBL7122016.1 hypothetical protein [Candidatus Neomarinimicrobiota bacterium]